jgi:hypothetical protein
VTARSSAGRALRATMFFAPVACIAACNVDPIAENARPAVENRCSTDRDCGSEGVCTNGACYARGSEFDEIVLEIIPDANSTYGGMSFVSVQSGLRRGNLTARTTTLTGPIPFTTQVRINGEELDRNCPYITTGKQSIAARIQFVRTGSVSGVAVADLSKRFTLTVDTEQTASGFSKPAALLPGIYDIHVQPSTTSTCQIASKLWRNVEVGRDGQVDASAPPATLDISASRKLSGSVARKGGNLADWQVDVVDPQDGRIISTSAKLGATSDATPSTNFSVFFHPLEDLGPRPSAIWPGGTGPLIRLRPPKEAVATTPSPTVYFDLNVTDIGATGEVGLDISKIPDASHAVTVKGQVRGITGGEGVRGIVKFLSVSLGGLITSFAPAIPTDGSGFYTAELLPGDYRVIAVPDGADDIVTTGATPPRQWATTSEARQRTITSEPNQVVDLSVLPVRILQGTATAGNFGIAQGANFEATLLGEGSSGVLDGIISPSTSRAPTVLPVDDENGMVSFVGDPGRYSLTLKPAAASNFAWWVVPEMILLQETEPGVVGTMAPKLLYPLRFEGTIAIASPNQASQPLRNATVQAYVRAVSQSGPLVRQVGTARTDDMGRYYLPLPPRFGELR